MSRRWRWLLAFLPGLTLAPFLCPSTDSVQGAPVPLARKPAVEVVFCLDTTGSMSGLLDGARLKIWSICNQILNGRPMPSLRVGLIAFRDKNDDYLTRVYDLRDDLDEVYGDLRTFSANGGGDTPEAVNHALHDAVHKIRWSEDKWGDGKQTLRIIFLVGDAPPHMDYPDDVKYPITCQKALHGGILINTIQCGTDADCTLHWKQIAEKAGGSYAAIPQGGGARGVATPHDRRLGEINAELTRTTLLFGDKRKRELDGKKVEIALALPAEVAADRAGYLAKEGKMARYDLLEALRAGTVKLEGLPAEELPAELQSRAPAERRDHLDRVTRQRATLLREARELDRQRGLHITRELTRNKDSFDGRVLDMLRGQARGRIRY